MNRDELLRILRRLQASNRDPEERHIEADEALLTFINDPDVSAAFHEIDKWYA